MGGVPIILKHPHPPHTQRQVVSKDSGGKTKRGTLQESLQYPAETWEGAGREPPGVKAGTPVFTAASKPRDEEQGENIQRGGKLGTEQGRKLVTQTLLLPLFFSFSGKRV